MHARLSVIFSFTILISLVLAGCASHPNVQPQINSLVIAERFDQALQILQQHKEGYGKNNELLFLLDEGMVLHLSKKYEQSIAAFAQAKAKFDELYTRSLSKISASLIVNDYTMPYRGEDFERVMINIFQALNYAMIGNIEEALVEARDADTTLTAINMQYDPGQKNVYKEDAFARLLMGVLYEISGKSADRNDAFISYVKALDIYEKDYSYNYALSVPEILKENLIRAARYMGASEQKKFIKKFAGIDRREDAFSGKDKAEVYLIHYRGLSPVKIQSSFTAPLPGGLLGRIAFPKYKERNVGDQPYSFQAKRGGTTVVREDTELGEDISAIAIKNLKNRQFRLVAKSVGRSAGKYFLAKKQAENIGKKHGDAAEEAFLFASSLYNIYSEQADIRSWQTLPGEVRVARLQVQPGVYKFYLNADLIGEHALKAGESKVLIYRTTY
ncbi:MAG: hypothetical protein KAR05_11525 [Candidatus Omnitrophica bacterium]|nr:hypothetical protein [Candidatus Omnitrophota bacterium]